MKYTLNDDLTFARYLAQEGGAILKKGWIEEQINITKKGDINLVTQYDFASEKKIKELISKERPDDFILAEESGGEKSGHRIWCIDPLDGTTNFAHGLPFFAVSIALLVDGKAKVGVVYNPALEMEFYASYSGGAFLNGKPLALLEKNRDLKESLLAFGCGYDRIDHPNRYLPMMEHFMKNSQGLRRTGSAAFDCCMVARGWIDAYAEVNLYPWDLAAGVLIANEAGAIASDVNGNEYNPFSGRVLVGRTGVHDQLLNLSLEKGLFDGEFLNRY